MTAAFKKGELVTVLKDWDRKGTVTFRQARVYSCGLKRMILTSLKTGEEFGRDFDAVKATGHEQGVHPVMTDEAALTICLEIGADVLEYQRAFLARCLAGNHGTGYDNSINQQINDLHEPRGIAFPEGETK